MEVVKPYIYIVTEFDFVVSNAGYMDTYRLEITMIFVVITLRYKSDYPDKFLLSWPVYKNASTG